MLTKNVKYWISSNCIFAKNIIAGKAMEISPDMVLFTNEIIELLEEGKYEIGKPILEREVDAKKNGKRIVKVIPVEQFQSINTKTVALANPRDGIISININKTIGRNEEGIILHELIHLFDPKLNNKNVYRRSKEWKSNIALPKNSSEDDKSDQYYRLPHEQDAYMAEKARDEVKNYSSMVKTREDLDSVLSLLRNMKPKDDAERAWYLKPKIWRKYLNTIYQRLIKIVGGNMKLAQELNNNVIKNNNDQKSNKNTPISPIENTSN